MRATIPETAERFWSKVEKGDGCWLWVGGRADGYGVFCHSGTRAPAHHMAWLLTHGALPGERLIHTCENNLCVRPDHLYRSTPEARFWEHVERGGVDECWAWNGAYRGVYGKFKVGVARQVLAHRFAWELVNGRNPDGLVIRHACDNPPCCNPAHLLVGTYKDNMQDAVARGRIAKGERAGAARLVAADIPRIRERLASGDYQRDIASDYGIAQASVWAIKAGKNWSHIP